MKKILEVKNLSVEFRIEEKRIEAVRNFTLDMEEKEIIVLAGESGSGKTIASLALTRILPALAKITAGEAYFEGKDLFLKTEIELQALRGAKISYIFQEPLVYLNPVFKISEQLKETIIYHDKISPEEANKRMLELLNLVKIIDPETVGNIYPHQLSGGMNQRVFIALALASNPKLIIADEPTTALDVITEAQILEMLKDLQNKLGFSLLFITHNLSIAKKIANRVFIMHRGEIVESEKTAEIFNSPKHIHTKELVYAYEKIGKL